MEITKYIKENIVLFDGAMGTMLQDKGLKIGENPEIFGFENQEKLLEIHKEYLKSGSNIITTNTFGANELKLDRLGYKVEDIVDNAIKIAKLAIEQSDKSIKRYVALDVGPIGEMLEPIGTMSFDRAYEVFKRQMVQGEKSGADIILIETMMDLYEAKAAVLAAKENTNLPVFLTMTFDENGRSFTGCMPESMVATIQGLGVDAIGVNCSLGENTNLPVFLTMTFDENGRSFTGCMPESMVATIQGLGVDAIGVNCSLGPKKLVPIVEKICKISYVPIIVQANAGLPDIIDGNAIYNIKEDEYLEGVKEFIQKGASIIGGCCGTTPNFIRKISDNLSNIDKIEVEKEHNSIICSPSKIVEIKQPTVIGERINPTGKKLLKESIRNENIDYIINLAIEQVNAGADIINVNVGLPGIDEKRILSKIIKEIQSIIDTPIQIDSSDINALEQGLRYYNGKTMLNSVNGKEKSLATILPIVKKYGSSVVGLTLDERGIPNTAQERFEIAKKIVERATSYGIKKEDIIIDCLCLTASAQQEEAMVTLECIKMIKEQLGVNTILGISNISFGLSNRKILNSTFLSMALSYGLDIPIMNPNEEYMMDVINSFKVIKSIDKGCIDYIDRYNGYTDKKKIISSNKELTLESIVVNGLKEEAKESTLKLLESKSENFILNEILIPSLDIVGKKYDKGEIFLPQLIQSAEAVKSSLNTIKEKLLKENYNSMSKGKIIVATVKGDIHDIGKNIVKIMLENYGYEVIDLGKDVPIEDVIYNAKKQNIKLVGLSALMTTTINSMKETIKALKDNNIKTKVFVGGAVLTEEYAKNIGADYYSKDAKSAIEIAKMSF